MKLMYGNVPVKSMNIHHFEMDTNDATLKASDLQSGVTAYAKGQKVTGTGKAFSFASYGTGYTNLPIFIPESINVIQIGSKQHPIKMTIPFQNMKTHNFNVSQKIAEAVIDGTTYPVFVYVQDAILNIDCDQTIDIELFYGKDEYI